jgi:peptidoglycan/LPS O-acetylase OafA/YrhL
MPADARRSSVPQGTNRANEQQESFRPDIQGMRAVAVLLVALQHAGVPHITGGYIGVDVFFVISGFLITGLLLRRADRTGSVQIGRFYAARARRILPAATLTLIATGLASMLWLNYVRAGQVLHDALWACAFAANIHFAEIGSDYFAQGSPPSPLQHFWTLAVEEQFYLAWPVLLAGAIMLMGRRRSGPQPRDVRMPRGPLAVLLLVVIAASLAWSISDTSSAPQAAYFSTFTRAWELAAGALLAVGATSVARVSPAVRTVAGWTGLAGILCAGTLYSPGTAFPGYAALLPVGATVLVLSAGLGGTPRRGPAVLLARAPFRFVGDVSYSFYLWHWPVLVIPMEYEGHALGLATNLLLLAAAFALSVVTYRLYENPLRHSAALSARPLAALKLWPVTVGAVALLGTAGIAYLNSEAPAPYTPRPLPEVASTSNHSTDPYAQAVAQNASAQQLAQPVPAQLAPAPAQLQGDRFDFGDCLKGYASNRVCRLGSTSPRHTVVVFGDSHTRMWMPALMYWAAQRHISLIPLVAEGCVAMDWVTMPSPPTRCTSWYTWALGEVRALHPDAVVIGTRYSSAEGGANALGQAIQGVTREMQQLRQRVPSVTVIEDPPAPSQDPVDCLLRPSATLGSCSFQLPNAWASQIVGDVATAATASDIGFLRTDQWFCARSTCPMVVDHIIVYTDDRGHISATYANWLKRPLARELSRVTGL